MTTDVVATVSFSVAASQWVVSEETLLADLAAGPDGPTQSDDGAWQIPTSWLDANYERSKVIDLRDIGSELSTMLDHLLVTRDRLSQAEVRAAVAENEAKHLEKDVKRLENELQRAESDAEHWMNQHDQREVDLVSERQKSLRAESKVETVRAQLIETESRLDDTYRELLKLQSSAEIAANAGLMHRIFRRKERS